MVLSNGLNIRPGDPERETLQALWPVSPRRAGRPSARPRLPCRISAHPVAQPMTDGMRRLPQSPPGPAGKLADITRPDHDHGDQDDKGQFERADTEKLHPFNLPAGIDGLSLARVWPACRAHH